VKKYLAPKVASKPIGKGVPKVKFSFLEGVTSYFQFADLKPEAIPK
jgi:hypothetical protein